MLIPRSRRASCSRSQIPFEAVLDGRIYIEKVNWPFLSAFKGSAAEYRAGLKLAIERGWIWLHESGTYVKFTESGANLFA